jgi:Flp pilus assembly protein TadG
MAGKLRFADPAAPRPAGLLRSFGRDQRGGFAIIFALALFPITLAVGAAVDYSVANKARTQFDAAADSAALAAVDKTEMSQSTAHAQTTATNVFNSYAATVKRATLGNLSVNVADGVNGRSAVVSYTASVPTAFMGLIGQNSVQIQGTATAVSGLSYVDFYLLLDNTPSMGVGATTADIATMVANTSDKCAFACHDVSNPNSYYNLAKQLGVQMRIDVVRQATQQLMDTAGATEVVSNQFRMAIYTFGDTAQSAGLNNIHSLDSSLTAAKNDASNIDLMKVPYQNYASDTDTDLPDMLTAINKEINAPGDGSSSGSPLKYLFLVSDGVSDRVDGSPACSQPTNLGSDPQTGKSYLRCQEPINVSYCTTLKSRGIRIAVLYTTYLPLPTNAWYNTWIAPFRSQIATNMQSCASPGFYFEVSPTQGISDAMTALFKKAVQEARLSQ